MEREVAQRLFPSFWMYKDNQGEWGWRVADASNA